MGALLGRIWPYLLVIAAIVAAALWIDARGYDRARSDASVAKAIEDVERAAALRVLEQELGARIAASDRQLADRFAAIGAAGRRLAPIVEEELARDPHLADPAAGLSVELRGAIDAARALSADPPGTASGDRRPVPGAAPTGG